ncbi:MAG: RNA polymerase sigma factor [Eubacteriales bacterium]|nr:RNA polymerase sigma factor [Eubacteriales bacterium]
MKNEEVIRLFDAYSDDLYRFAVYYVGSKHDAEDIVQDVFLKLLSKHVVLKHGKERAYLMTMTANSCKNYLKSAFRKTNVDIELAEMELQYFDDFTERNREVFDELMRLEGQYRIPIYLHFYVGYSYKEIAKIINISESLVAVRINRGKAKLRINLEELL